MTIPEGLWKKSSFSGPETDCVEIRHDLAAMRDSKTAGAGNLVVDVRGLVDAVRRGVVRG